jgi:hypothetical protein
MLDDGAARTRAIDSARDERAGIGGRSGAPGSMLGNTDTSRGSSSAGNTHRRATAVSRTFVYLARTMT